MSAEVFSIIPPELDPGTSEGQPDQPLELQLADAAKQPAQSDTANQQLQRILELQDQNLKMQTEILKVQTELLERAKTQDEHAVTQAEQRSKVDTPDFWRRLSVDLTAGLFYDEAALSGWFLCFLKALFAAEPRFFESEEVKVNFALSRFSKARIRAYQEYVSRCFNPGTPWCRMESFLRQEYSAC